MVRGQGVGNVGCHDLSRTAPSCFYPGQQCSGFPVEYNCPQFKGGLVVEHIQLTEKERQLCWGLVFTRAGWLLGC